MAAISRVCGAFAQSNRIDIVTPSAPELASYGPLSIGVRTLKQYVAVLSYLVDVCFAGRRLGNASKSVGAPTSCVKA